MNEVLTLDGDFAEKLKTVLSDPEAMAKISAIASGLGASAQTETTNEPEKEAETVGQSGVSDILPVLSQSFSPQSDPRLALLYSLKPLLREDKRDKIDSLTKALTIASMMKQFRK